jgi:hypothetical protein
MKKLGLAVLLVVGVAGQGAAQAVEFQDAREWSSRSDLCANYAGHARFRYTNRDKTFPPLPPEDAASTIMHAWAFDYVTKATDEEDVYKRVFIVCMENINRLIREEKAGLTRQMEIR